MFQLEHLYMRPCEYDCACIMAPNETSYRSQEGSEGKPSEEDDQPECFGGGAEGAVFDSGADGVVPADQEAGYAAPGCGCDCLVQEIRARLPDADQSGAAEDDEG